MRVWQPEVRRAIADLDGALHDSGSRKVQVSGGHRVTDFRVFRARPGRLLHLENGGK